jgi:hypothetical protein
VAGRASPFAEYGWASAVVALATAVSFLAERLLSLTDAAMVFLLGVAVVASRYGRRATIFASVLSIAVFDFFFVPPKLTFAVSDVATVTADATALLTRVDAADPRAAKRRRAPMARRTSRGRIRTPREVVEVAGGTGGTSGRRPAAPGPDGTCRPAGLTEKERSVASGPRHGRLRRTDIPAEARYLPC